MDLAALNVFAPAFGLPIAPGTNGPAENLSLDLKVNLTEGRVRLSLANATAPFRVLFRSPYTGRWETLADSASLPVRDMAVEEWRRLFRQRSGAAFAAIFSTSSSSSLLGKQ